MVVVGCGGWASVVVMREGERFEREREREICVRDRRGMKMKERVMVR